MCYAIMPVNTSDMAIDAQLRNSGQRPMM